jgi:hypothetical protein
VPHVSFSSRTNRHPNSSSSINHSDEKTSPRAVRRILFVRPPHASLSLSPDSNPLPRSSHVSPPSPPSASGRSERDAPPTVAHDPDARARPRRPKDGARRRHPSCGWQVDGPQAEVPYSSLYRGWASYPRSRTRGVGRSRQRTGDVAGPVQRRVSGRRRMCVACQCCFSWGRSWLCWVLLTITSLAKKGDYN